MQNKNFDNWNKATNPKYNLSAFIFFHDSDLLIWKSFLNAWRLLVLVWLQTIKSVQDLVCYPGIKRSHEKTSGGLVSSKPPWLLPLLPFTSLLSGCLSACHLFGSFLPSPSQDLCLSHFKFLLLVATHHLTSVFLMRATSARIQPTQKPPRSETTRVKSVLTCPSNNSLRKKQNQRLTLL